MAFREAVLPPTVPTIRYNSRGRTQPTTKEIGKDESTGAGKIEGLRVSSSCIIGNDSSEAGRQGWRKERVGNGRCRVLALPNLLYQHMRCSGGKK